MNEMPRRRTLLDADFGLLRHEVGDLWTREIGFRQFGADWTIALHIAIDEEVGIEANQRQAIRFFEGNSKDISQMAEQEVSRLATQNGADAATIADSVAPVAIEFPYAEFRSTFGILYTVDWDPGHGAAVVFIDGQFAEAGSQDIVL